MNYRLIVVLLLTLASNSRFAMCASLEKVGEQGTDGSPNPMPQVNEWRNDNSNQSCNQQLDSSSGSIFEHVSLPGWDVLVSNTFLSSGGDHAAVAPKQNAMDGYHRTEQNLLFEEFNYIGMLERTYKRGQRFVIAQVYEFKESQGAYAAYCFLHKGASTVITRGDASSEDDQSISFCKGNYFVYIRSTFQDDEESKQAINEIATQFGSVITSQGQVPLVLKRLPELDRIHGSEKLVFGAISARKFFPAPYMGTLQLEKAKGAATADYRFQAPYHERLKLLYIDYGDAQLANESYYNYIRQLEDGRGSHVRTTINNSTSLHKLSGNYLFCKVNGSKVILITGARKRISSAMLARAVM